jgi:RNA polymerase sigma factor (sigma-70 family)
VFPCTKQNNTVTKPAQKLISADEYLVWKDFKSGDLAAYSLIYRKYFFILYNYGLKFCSDKELIKDCIQDLFIKIWNNRENLNDTTSVKYYLFTSLKNKLIDALKSSSQKFKVSDDVMNLDVVDEEDSESELFYFQKERVFSAMNKLSRHQQKVLEMKFYKNQSNQEIAQELGITIQSVYNSVFKTLRSLRKQLEIGLLLILFHL